MQNMNSKQSRRAEFFTQMIKRTDLPRNQIASLSGITNTYIRDMELGSFNNVSRVKLITLSICMNMTLDETDEMLTHFDRAMLSEEDIQIYINAAKQIKPSSVMHPVRIITTYELLMLAAEMLDGPKVMTGSHPTAVLQVEGHRAYKIKSFGKIHPLYLPLIEEIGNERRRLLTSQILKNRMDHFIDLSSLKNYVGACQDPVEKKYRQKHLEAIMLYLNNYPNFHYHITEHYPGAFSYLLKFSEKKAGRVFFASHSLHEHGHTGARADKVLGLYTANKNIITQFKKDLEFDKAQTLEEYADRDRLISLLQAIKNG
jgi:transcriptional regulator with XRE-family HTH domain